MKSIQVLSPATSAELNELMAQYPDARLLAGATDLIPLLQRGLLAAELLIDLHRLRDELGVIEIHGDRLIIGSMTTIAAVAAHNVIRQQFPLLAQAAEQIGARQIQNMATLGGNIANASPSADSVPPLLVYNAVLVLQSAKGQRELPLREFFLDYKKMALKPTEWIRGILIEAPPTARSFYSKTGARRAQAIAKLSLAALIGDSGSGIFRVAAGAMSPFPRRLEALEQYVIQKLQAGDQLKEQQLRKQIATDLSPIDDIRSTAVYRLQVAQNILCNFLREAGYELA